MKKPWKNNVYKLDRTLRNPIARSGPKWYRQPVFKEGMRVIVHDVGIEAECCNPSDVLFWSDVREDGVALGPDGRALVAIVDLFRDHLVPAELSWQSLCQLAGCAPHAAAPEIVDALLKSRLVSLNEVRRVLMDLRPGTTLPLID